MTEDSLLKLQLDEYHLLSLLKGGGMARVYLGFDERLRRYLAVKIMYQPLRTDPNYTRRFEQEARTIGQLEHPNIVRLYRYGNVNGLLYMAMQYIEGADLRGILDAYQRQGELLDPSDIASIIRSICLALDYAHSRGIIHRDVKPSNILISKDGHVFLADFGISLFTEFETRGEVFGTPHYVAPEQAISSDQAVAQSDLYSVGIILYEMFTGKLPFDAPEPLNIAQQHINQPPTPPSAIRPELNPAIEAVILKALAKAPSARYATGAELADALDGALQTKRNAFSPLALSPQLLKRIVQLTGPLPVAVIAPAAYIGPAAPTQTLEQSAISATVPQRRFSRASLGIAAAALLLLLALVAAFAWFPGNIRAGGSAADATSVAQSVANSIVIATVPIKNTPTHVPILAATATTIVSPTATATKALSPTVTTIARSPNATATVTQAATVAVTAKITAPIATPVAALPTVTVTVQPTRSVAVSQVSTATVKVQLPLVALASDYTLIFAKNYDQSLFVVNMTDRDFPLAQLALRNNNGEMKGGEWGITLLAPKSCVTVSQDSHKASLQNMTCSKVGQRLVRKGRDRFWRNDFDVFYNGQWVGTCPKDKAQCLVTTAAKPQNSTVKQDSNQQDGNQQDNNQQDNGKKKDQSKGGD